MTLDVKNQFPIFKQKIKGKDLVYLDSANSSTDAFGVAVAGLTAFDMSTEPGGSLATEDLGALT